MSKKVGLLGGSFNPAHDGHIDISITALKHLGLDEVWWLVSPHNPLKNISKIAPISHRLNQATTLCKGYPIIVKDVESALHTPYTYDVLVHLKQSFKDIQFVWLMGADNFIHFDKWYKWRAIPNIVPIALFNRPDYKSDALQSVASGHMQGSRTTKASDLFEKSLPQWIYIESTNNPQSATTIRQKCNEKWWK